MKIAEYVLKDDPKDILSFIGLWNLLAYLQTGRITLTLGYAFLAPSMLLLHIRSYKAALSI